MILIDFFVNKTGVPLGTDIDSKAWAELEKFGF